MVVTAPAATRHHQPPRAETSSRNARAASGYVRIGRMPQQLLGGVAVARDPVAARGRMVSWDRQRQGSRLTGNPLGRS